MTSNTAPRNWADIRWPEIDPVARSHWIAVLPLAATEQHGPHLPLATDTLIANAFLTEVWKKLPADIPATFLPIEAIGLSTEHIDYPGTVTLPYDLAIRNWLAIGEDVARNGIKKIVMVSSHGGNSAAMTIVAQELRARHGMLAVTTNWHRFGIPPGLFPDDEVKHGVHGGAIETSIMLAAHPDLVRQEKIADFKPASVAMTGEFRWLSPHRPAPFAWAAQDLHPSGVAGNATLADATKGRHLLDHGAQAFCELLADINGFDLARLSHRPQI
ncbi:MAG: creatininase family protein [Xanthobacteraceae bacterium]|nr:creatininase family protein [Xanthobacteraceae bacterium]